MKSCLCIFLGLPRTILQCFENIKNNLINNNSKDFVFEYLVNTEGTEDEINVIKNVLNISDKDIILFNVDKNHIKTSCHVYMYRLFQCLKKKQDCSYDIYINLRFDIEINKPVDLHNYLDKFCLITGSFTRACSFHNRDWDLMSIGNNFSYKMLNYPILNECLKTWYKEELEPLVDKNIDTTIKDNFISDKEMIEVNHKCGLVTYEPIQLFSLVIKNLLNNGGTYIVSEKFEKVHAYIIRSKDYNNQRSF